MTVIDVSEDKLHREEPKVLELLLKDQTTRRNIVWGTASYDYLGCRNATFSVRSYEPLARPSSEKPDSL